MGRPVEFPMGRPTAISLARPMGRPMGILMGRPMGRPMGIHGTSHGNSLGRLRGGPSAQLGRTHWLFICVFSRISVLTYWEVLCITYYVFHVSPEMATYRIRVLRISRV